MSRLSDLAWAAGVWEGEGCFSLARQKKPKRGVAYIYAMATLTMTDEDIVRRLGEIIGMGTVKGPYTYKSGGRKLPYWEFRIQGKGALEVAELFRPWLGKRRLKQVEAMRQRNSTKEKL